MSQRGLGKNIQGFTGQPVDSLDDLGIGAVIGLGLAHLNDCFDNPTLQTVALRWSGGAGVCDLLDSIRPSLSDLGRRLIEALEGVVSALGRCSECIYHGIKLAPAR